MHGLRRIRHRVVRVTVGSPRVPPEVKAWNAGRRNPRSTIVKARLSRLRDAAGTTIAEPELDLVEGTGNVFRDLGDRDADLKHAKAILAADIICALDDRCLSVRKAGEATDFAAADYSQVRNANLGRFTMDRQMRRLGALHRAAGTTTPMRWRAPVRHPIPAPNSTAAAPMIVDKSYVQGAGSLSRDPAQLELAVPGCFLLRGRVHEPVGASVLSVETPRTERKLSRRLSRLQRRRVIANRRSTT